MSDGDGCVHSQALAWEGGRGVVMVVKGKRGRGQPLEVVVGEMVAMGLKTEHNIMNGFLPGD